MTINLADRLRLQIGVPAAGLPNLIRNSSGEMYAAGWSTPAATSALLGRGDDPAVFSRPYLYLHAQATGPVYAVSDSYAAAAGRWVAARIETGRVWGAFTLRVEALNSAGAVIGTSLSSGYQTTLGVHYSTSYQLPAGTTHARIRIDLYSNSSGATPVNGNQTAWIEAMLTHSAAGTGTGTRTNLCKNPSFETNATHWAGGTRQTIAARVGTASYSIVGTLAHASYNDPIPVTPGTLYSLSGYLCGLAGTASYYAEITWNRGSEKPYRSRGSTIAVPNATWVRAAISATAPAGAVSATLRFVRVSSADTVLLDTVLFEENGGETRPYFDGATTLAGHTLAWTGTAHASTSTDTAPTLTGFAYSPAYEWLDVLGATHEISIDTAALDTGTLTAEILDSTLDPALADTVRPGKPVRLQALAADRWEDLFVGETAEGTTAYAIKGLNITVPGAVRVTVTAANATKTLANQPEARGVENVVDLSTLLEGKGVAWQLNGSTQLGPDAAVISRNDSASVLDQIAVTCASNVGYAWICESNVLHADDASEMVTDPYWTFTDDLTGLGDEYSYTDIDVGYSTADCINQVTVKFLRYDAEEQTTEEIAYGPYADADSVATYGAYAKEFTIQGVTEDPVAIEAYAQAILTANAVPEVTAKSLTLNAQDDDGIFYAAFTWLMDPVRVVYSDRLDTVARVTSISHRIVATNDGGRWTTTFGFAPTGSVAQPRITPSPPANVDAVGLLSSRGRSANQSIANNTWTTIILNVSQVDDGIPYNATTGIWTVPKKGRYLVTGQAYFVGNATGRRLFRIDANGASQLQTETPTGSSGNTPSTGGSKILKLNAGSTVTMLAFQTSGGNLDITTGCKGDITYLGR